jgi:hypothetical protein
MMRSADVRQVASCGDFMTRPTIDATCVEGVQTVNEAMNNHIGWASIISNWGSDTTPALVTHECIESTKASISSSAGSFYMKDVTFAIFVNVMIVSVSGLIVMWVVYRGSNPSGLFEI